MRTALDLLRLQLATLFTLDAAGRLLAVNEADGGPAPRIFLGRTPAGNLWRVRHDLPADLAGRLEQFAAAEPVTPGPAGDPVCSEELRALLAAGATVRDEYSGPAYHFPDQIARPNGVVALTEADAELVWPGFPALPAELAVRQPCLAVVRDGMAVSICFSARRSARAAEAGVETLESSRGRGYATAVTAAWALAVRAEGLIPLYSTWWNNHASRAVARRLGLIQYGADWHVD